MHRSDAQSSGLHNVVTLQVVRHVWSGIHVHDIRMKALPGRSWHPLNCDRPVLSIVVNELRGQCEARLDLSARNAPRQSGRQRPVGHISLIPAGVPAWGYSDGIDQVEELDELLLAMPAVALTDDLPRGHVQQVNRLIVREGQRRARGDGAFEGSPPRGRKRRVGGAWRQVGHYKSARRAARSRLFAPLSEDLRQASTDKDVLHINRCFEGPAAPRPRVPL